MIWLLLVTAPQQDVYWLFLVTARRKKWNGSISYVSLIWLKQRPREHKKIGGRVGCFLREKRRKIIMRGMRHEAGRKSLLFVIWRKNYLPFKNNISAIPKIGKVENHPLKYISYDKKNHEITQLTPALKDEKFLVVIHADF